VLARELNLGQVRRIYEQILKQDLRGPDGELIRIELFAHGALCMATSGKCYLSLHEYGKSANRGECYQICRRTYSVRDRETGHELDIDNEYIMSPRDLSTIGFLDKIIESGVRILKIEGRARSAEYVKTVTSCYDEAIKSIAENSYTDEKIANWNSRLSTVFNRGFWDGYYLGRRLGEWTDKYGSSATKRKIYLGKVTNYFAKINVAEIKLETGDLSKGDSLIFTGPSTGMIEYTADGIRVNLEETSTARKGESCSVKIDQLLRRSDKVYKWVDTDRSD
jgi:putative protease